MSDQKRGFSDKAKASMIEFRHLFKCFAEYVLNRFVIRLFFVNHVVLSFENQESYCVVRREGIFSFASRLILTSFTVFLIYLHFLDL